MSSVPRAEQKANMADRVIYCKLPESSYTPHPWEMTEALQATIGLAATVRTYAPTLLGLAVHAGHIKNRDCATAVPKSICHACVWLRHLFADGANARP